MHSSKNEKKKSKEKSVSTEAKDCKCFAPAAKVHHDDCILVSRPCPFHCGRFCLNLNIMKKEEDYGFMLFHPGLNTDGMHRPVSSLLSRHIQYCSPKETIKHHQITSGSKHSLHPVSSIFFEDKGKSCNSEKANKMKKGKQCFHSLYNSHDQRIRLIPVSLKKLNEILREDGKKTQNDSLSIDKSYGEKYSKERKLDYANMDSNGYFICNQSDKDKSSLKSQLDAHFLSFEKKPKHNFRTIEVYPVSQQNKKLSIYDQKIKDIYDIPDFLSPSPSKVISSSSTDKITNENDQKQKKVKENSNEESQKNESKKSLKNDLEKPEKEELADKNMTKLTPSDKSLSDSSASLYYTPFILNPEKMKDEEIKLVEKPALVSRNIQTSKTILSKGSDKSIQVRASEIAELKNEEPEKLSGKSPERSPQKSPETSPEKSDQKSTEISPQISSEKLPQKSPKISPEISFRKSSEKLSQKSPIRSSEISPQKSLEISPKGPPIISDMSDSLIPAYADDKSMFAEVPSFEGEDVILEEPKMSFEKSSQTIFQKKDESHQSPPLSAIISSTSPLVSPRGSPVPISPTVSMSPPQNTLTEPLPRNTLTEPPPRNTLTEPPPQITLPESASKTTRYTQTELCVVATVPKFCEECPLSEGKSKNKLKDSEVQTSPMNSDEFHKELPAKKYKDRISIDDKKQQASRLTLGGEQMGPSATDVEKPNSSTSISSIKGGVDYLFAPAEYYRSHSDGDLYEKKNCDYVVYENDVPVCNCCCVNSDSSENNDGRTDSQATYNVLIPEKVERANESSSTLQMAPRNEIKSSYTDLGDLIKVINDNFRRMSQKLLQTHEHPCCPRCGATESKPERVCDPEVKADVVECSTQTSKENLPQSLASESQPQPGVSSQKDNPSCNPNVLVCDLCSKKLNVVLVNSDASAELETSKIPTVNAETLCNIINTSKSPNKKNLPTTLPLQRSTSSSIKSFLEEVITESIPEKTTFGKSLNKRPMNSFVLHERRLSKSSQENNGPKKNVIFKPVQGFKNSLTPIRTVTKPKPNNQTKKTPVFNECPKIEKINPTVPSSYDNDRECVCEPQNDICPSLPTKPWPGTRANVKKPNNSFSYSVILLPSAMSKEVMKTLQDSKIKLEKKSCTNTFDSGKSFKRNFEKQLKENDLNEKKIKTEIEKEIKNSKIPKLEGFASSLASKLGSKEKSLSLPEHCVSQANTYLPNCVFNFSRPDNEPKKPYCFYECGVCKSLSSIDPYKIEFPSLFFKSKPQQPLKNKQNDIEKGKSSKFEFLSFGEESCGNPETVPTSEELYEEESGFSEKVIRIIRDQLKNQEESYSKTKIRPTDWSKLYEEPSSSNTEDVPSHPGSLIESTSEFFRFRGDSDDKTSPGSSKGNSEKMSRKKKRRRTKND